MSLTSPPQDPKFISYPGMHPTISIVKVVNLLTMRKTQSLTEGRCHCCQSVSHRPTNVSKPSVMEFPGPRNIEIRCNFTSYQGMHPTISIAYCCRSISHQSANVSNSRSIPDYEVYHGIFRIARTAQTKTGVHTSIVTTTGRCNIFNFLM